MLLGPIHTLARFEDIGVEVRQRHGQELQSYFKLIRGGTSDSMVRDKPFDLADQSGVSAVSRIKSSSLLPGIQGWTDSTHRATGFEVGADASISADS